LLDLLKRLSKDRYVFFVGKTKSGETLKIDNNKLNSLPGVCTRNYQTDTKRTGRRGVITNNIVFKR
jgi:hypothetical protein